MNAKKVNLPIEYSDKKVTPFGGLSLLKRFIDKTEVINALNDINLLEPGSNRGYQASDIVLSFWLGIWTGASRYIHCNWVRYDKVLQEIFSLEKCPRKVPIVDFLTSLANQRMMKYFLPCSIG